uniref:Uncharacterized protein n=1 Tax=Bionectria ochroleuca TaxID=29856 RepID=A0A0B7KSM9_BIOOC
MVNHHRFSYNQCSTSSEIASRLEYSLITGPLMRHLPSGGQTINHMGSLNWIGILKRGQYSLYGHQVAHPLSLDPRIVGALQCPTGVSGQASLLAFNPMMHTERFLLKLLNPQLLQSLSEEQKQSVREEKDYITLSQKIDVLGTQIGSLACYNKDKITRLMMENLQSERISLYKERERIFTTKLKKLQTTQKISYSNKKRIRLAAVMHKRIRPRSSEWINALKDLVTLRNSDCSVAYQPGLRPKGGHYPYCKTEMKRSMCFPAHLHITGERTTIPNFAFIAMTSKIHWENHLQAYLDSLDIPTRCNPVVFRHAIACAGYCPVHLGDTNLTPTERMKQFLWVGP